MRVALVPKPNVTGFNSVASSDWRVSPYSPGNGHGVRAWPVVDFETALHTEYRSWTLFMPYIAEGVEPMPRVNKPGLKEFVELTGVEPKTIMLVGDIDNPGHGLWTPELEKEFFEVWNNAPSLQDAGVFWTEHGWRPFLQLERPIPVLQAERTLAAWHKALLADGILADPKCKEWNRCYALPHCSKSGKPFRSKFVDTSRMRPVHVEPLPEAAVKTGRGQKRSTKLFKAPTFKTEPPEGWGAAVQRLSDVLLKTEGNWHELAMALSGALLDEGYSPEIVPAVVHAAFVGTNADTKPDDRLTAAKTTVVKFGQGDYVIGKGVLFEQWPRVALAVDQVRGLLNTEAKDDSPKAKEEAYEALEEEIRTASDGVTLVGAECGLGKTRAAIKVAVERAQKPGRLQTKTAISVDKNELAKQIVDDIKAAGGTAQRYFGPLSLKNKDGSYVCHYHQHANPLQNGGQSVAREFCLGRGKQKCEHYETCPAKDGIEGDTEARIVVGTHALIRNLAAKAGTTGLMVIDEPPAVMGASSLTLPDVLEAEKSEASFESSYIRAMKPLFRAFAEWFRERAEVEKTYSLEELVTLSRSAILADELDSPLLDSVEEAIRMAREACEDCHAPPLLRSQVSIARSQLVTAQSLGKASSVYNALQQAVSSKAPTMFWVSETSKGRVANVLLANETYVDVLNRQGATIVSDANIALHVPGISKVVQYEPRVQMFGAVDGSYIERTQLCVQASRNQWFSHGRPVYSSGLARAIQYAIEWAGGEKLGLITYLAVRLDLEANKVPGVKLPPGTVMGHYGATRGKNDMKDVDCLATVGDPWPNLCVSENEAKYLGVDDPMRRSKAHAQAELEQAHGRLRVVHRTRSGRALHIGNVLPGGSGWARSDVIRHNLDGRAALPGNMTSDEFCEIVEAVGGPTQAAKLLDCTTMTIWRYSNGKTTISHGTAVAARNLIEKEAAE